jgi:hypothetical protein
MKSFYGSLKKFRSVFILFIMFTITVTAQNPTQSLMDINNITSWVKNDGFHDWLVGNLWNGAFPNGNFIGSIFSEGIVWGGLVNDGGIQLVRVNGNTYLTGCSLSTRLFRVRTDYLTSDLISDASNFFNVPVGQVTQNMIDELRQQYETDWNEWPAEEGAPFTDNNENGTYNPETDIPGVTGAQQTLFIKYNDTATPLYGADSIGLDISETYWAYANSGAADNVIFKKVDISYHGTVVTSAGSFIDSMYICQWVNASIGNYSDDFAGCDTSLNLGYAYNADDVDDFYNGLGLKPPAIGYVFLQGFSSYTGNTMDSAIINLRWQHGYKYANTRPMTRFIYVATGGTWSEPSLDYTGSLEFYNYMRGYKPYPYYPISWEFPSIVSDYTTSGVFLLDGDPVTGTGKIDGVLEAPGHRRFFSVSGPFRLDLGETAEVVVALVAGMGTSNLNSITKLKENTFVADTTFLGLVNAGQTTILSISDKISNNVAPHNFVLHQNYPNPFNPSTKIKFTIPSVEKGYIPSLQTTLKVYDILGREIATLVNEGKPAGEYEVEFDGTAIPSGVYFYQLKAGNFVETKKMILIR